MIIAPDRIRTYDLRFRKPALYPTELRALTSLYIITYKQIDFIFFILVFTFVQPILLKLFSIGKF